MEPQIEVEATLSRSIDLKMDEESAGKLMHLLRIHVSWHSDVYGDVAKEIFFLLEDIGVREA